MFHKILEEIEEVAIESVNGTLNNEELKVKGTEFEG